jgi:hypothetical protein
MTTRAAPTPQAWAFTDVDGRIESASPDIGMILGVGHLRRGDDLLDVIPLLRKALLVDIEAALDGWPSSRTVSLDAPGLRQRSVRYRVSRRFQETGIGLFWLIDELSSTTGRKVEGVA